MSATCRGCGRPPGQEASRNASEIGAVPVPLCEWCAATVVAQLQQQRVPDLLLDGLGEAIDYLAVAAGIAELSGHWALAELGRQMGEARDDLLRIRDLASRSGELRQVPDEGEVGGK
jgi:hypothetical protein